MRACELRLGAAVKRVSATAMRTAQGCGTATQRLRGAFVCVPRSLVCTSSVSASKPRLGAAAFAPRNRVR
eukprot:6110794-Prymnesium_polylepis.1